MFFKKNKVLPEKVCSMYNSVIPEHYNFDDIYDMESYKEQIKEKNDFIKKLLKNAQRCKVCSSLVNVRRDIV